MSDGILKKVFQREYDNLSFYRASIMKKEERDIPWEIHQACDSACEEVFMAMHNWPEFNSAHEGFAVLLEEVDELKAHVWMKQKNRDLIAMRKEAIQVAAMAVRFAVEICNEDKGRK